MIKTYKVTANGQTFMAVWTKMGYDDMVVILDGESVNDGPVCAAHGIEFYEGDVDDAIRHGIAQSLAELNTDEYRTICEGVKYTETFSDDEI